MDASADCQHATEDSFPCRQAQRTVPCVARQEEADEERANGKIKNFQNKKGFLSLCSVYISESIPCHT